MRPKRKRFGVRPALLGIIAVSALLAATALANEELLERALAYKSEMKKDGFTSDEVRQFERYCLDYLEKEPDSPHAYWVYMRLGALMGQFAPADTKRPIDKPKSYEYYRKCLETAPEGMLDSSILLANSNLSGARRIYENLDEYVAAQAKVWRLCNSASQLSDVELMARIPASHDERIADITGWSAEKEFEELRSATDPATGVPDTIRKNTLLITDHSDPVEGIRRCGLIEKHFAGTVVAEDARKKRKALEQIAREELSEEASRGLEGYVLQPEEPGEAAPDETVVDESAPIAEDEATTASRSDKRDGTGLKVFLVGALSAIVLIAVLAYRFNRKKSQ